MAFESSEITIEQGGPTLEAYLTMPKGAGSSVPGVVLVHGFPSIARPGKPSQSYHLLAERISDELGWAALAVSLRGCGDSEGQFSVSGWISDVDRAVATIGQNAKRVCLIGSTTGGSLAIVAAALNPAVGAVAAIAARADFDDWAAQPQAFLDHCRRVKVVDQEGYPESLQDWSAELKTYRPIDHVSKLAGRELMVIHGAADRQVPAGDARVLADAHGSAHLRILDGGDHRVRHDPRCVALLFGWLDRQSD